MNGMSLYETATVLGHKDTQTTTRYAHLSIEHIVCRQNILDY
jgi:site-specific recombinase XerD